jgi:SanA protein
MLRTTQICRKVVTCDIIISSVKSLLRKTFFLVVGLAIVLVASPILWRNLVKVYYQPAIFVLEEVPQRPVAIVFGAAVYGNGRLSAVLRDRVDTAIELYKSGQVDRILVSGDNESADHDEPGAMMAYAIEQGVDPVHITVDRAGQRTYDTCFRASHVFDVKSAVLVTQAFHLPRAMMTCENLGIEVVGAKADKRPYRAARWYEVRETAATLVAVWDVLRREPPSLLEATSDDTRSLPYQFTRAN